MFTAIVFILINIVCVALALLRGPFWALLVYANIYFNPPLHDVNWWAVYLPDARWSLMAFGVLGLSMFVHRDKLSDHPFQNIRLMYLFFLLILLTTFVNAADLDEAKYHCYMFFTFCITVYAIIRSINSFNCLRYFVMCQLVFCSNLALKAVFEGKRVHARLEGIGTADSLGANEFGLLLAAVVPFVIPFIVRGNHLERIISILSLPLIVNGIILTNSRTALVALFLSIVYGFIFLADAKLKKYIIIFLILLIPAFGYLADDHFVERMSTLIVSDSEVEGGMNEVSSGRLAIWGYGLEMAKDHPMGVGPGGFRAISRFYMPDEILVFKPERNYGARAAHNSYLLVLVEQGYLGLLIFLTICLSTLYYLLKSLISLRNSNALYSFTGLMVFSINLSFVVTLLGANFTSRVYYEFFWWQLALAVVGCSFIKKMKNETN